MSSFTAVADVAASSPAKAGADNPADAMTKSSERVDRVFIFCALVVSKSKRAIPSVVPKAERIKEAWLALTKGAAAHWGREFLEAWLITERHAGGWFPFGGLCCVEAGFPGREKSH